VKYSFFAFTDGIFSQEGYLPWLMYAGLFCRTTVFIMAGGHHMDLFSVCQKLEEIFNSLRSILLLKPIHMLDSWW